MAISDVPTDKLPEIMQIFFDDALQTIAPVLEWLSWLLGGLFGLYAVYFLIRLYFDRKRIVILKQVRGDVEFLKEHSLNGDELSKLRVILNSYPGVKKANGKKKVVKRKVIKKKNVKNKKKSSKRKK